MKYGGELFFGGFLLLVVAGLPGCATNAITGRSQLMLVSEKTAIAESVGAYSSLMEGLSKEGKLGTDAGLIGRIHGITNRLITQAVQYRPESREWKWSVNVIDEPKTVNAFCMAGGKMAVYTGLIDKIGPTDDELAQVMSHEIAHALANHSAEKMSIAMAAGLAVVTATAMSKAENKPKTEAMSAIAALTLISLPNSRETEAEADRIGIELAARAGYAPHAAVTLWSKMMKTSGSTSRFDFLSTHPSSTKRIEMLAALENSMTPVYDAGKPNRKRPPVEWIKPPAAH